ncbi:MAG TPA: flavin reductase family protein [Methylovirgula sp.]|jgi:flavin reductase|nr:flavin reductase family protein [Methylovirgula sp.]
MTEDPAPGNAHLATPIDSGRFREAMSRVAGAVHVVTTAGQAGLGGITASSVTSITVEPPMMLFCINTTSPSAQRILDNRAFCINTLTAADEHLSEIFAGRTHQHLEERFTSGAWTKLATGAPVLSTALAAFDCRLIEAKEVSTHLIVMGVVEAVAIASGGEALLYAHRKYRSLMLD